MSALMYISLMKMLLVFKPPQKEALLLTFWLTYHAHGLHLQKFSGLIHQIEVLEICHRSLPVNMSTDCQNPPSAQLSHTQYLWSRVENLWKTLVLHFYLDTQTPYLLTLVVPT